MGVPFGQLAHFLSRDLMDVTDLGDTVFVIMFMLGTCHSPNWYWLIQHVSHKCKLRNNRKISSENGTGLRTPNFDMHGSGTGNQSFRTIGHLLTWSDFKLYINNVYVWHLPD